VAERPAKVTETISFPVVLIIHPEIFTKEQEIPMAKFGLTS
jgi:hypothetical protein